MHGNVCLHKIANYVETGKALSLHLNILNLNVFLNKPQKNYCYEYTIGVTNLSKGVRRRLNVKTFFFPHSRTK